MAALAQDLEAQRSEDPDLAHSSFGELLVRIDAICFRATNAAPVREHLLRAADRGYVVANIPSATSLASMLDQLGAEQRREPGFNLWLLLSLWHRNVTSMMLDEASKHEAELKRLKIIESFAVAPYAPKRA